jgi:hypothetical protein
MATMNPFQRIAARAYDGGRFAHLLADADWPNQLPRLGDTLFAFIMVELSSGEGCKDVIDAVHRMMRAGQKLMAVVDALNRTGKH